MTLGAKSALAQPGGQGRGKGKGRGQARGHGNSETLNGVANGYSGDKSANGRALGHEVDGVSGVGHATAPGQAKKAAYDGMYDKLEVKGSFNAIHSAAINKGVVAPQSRVARVKAYLDAIQDLDELQGMMGVSDEDLQDAIDAAAAAAVAASSQPVTEAMLDEVNHFANKRDLVDPEIDLDPGTTKEVAEEAAKI
ncbi:MAG: hypothetical protein V3S23_02030 [Kiloniellales bacterium]